MCGIAGIVAPGYPTKPLAQTFSAMLGGLQHRGPDGTGSFVDRGIALGHTRLAIIDLEPTGQQPMTNEDATLQIVVNGEIYNYRELRKDLQDRGHRFRSKSDSEVVLHLYEDFGDDCVQHLDGMFAFALWDAPRHRLLLARDRFGMKPLLFTQEGDTLVFASELTALVCGEMVTREIHLESLYAYLTFGYIPGQLSIFSGVEKVQPAERVVWEHGTLTRDTYWMPQPAPLKMSRANAKEVLSAQLETSMQTHLVADVPVAAFLSGGVDSSAVVAMARRHQQIQTFCVAFPGTGHDESPIAQTIATHLQSEHQTVHVPLNPMDLLFQSVGFMDEPFADSSALPTFAVSRAARNVAKVVLSGDGGDEVFGGYTGRYRVAALQAVIPIPDMVARGLQTLPPWRGGRRSSLPQMLGLAALSDEERFVVERQITSPEQRMALFGFDRSVQLEPTLRAIPRSAIQYAAQWHPVHRALWIDLRTSLPDDMLTKVDRMSMAHGLEVRLPFLDYHLVEFAFSLPSSWLVSPWPVEGKRLLRQVVAPLLPAGILNRPKQGFSIPLNSWLKHHFLEVFDDLCLDANAQIRQFFDRKGIAAIRQKPIADRPREDLYGILVLELWLRGLQQGTRNEMGLT